MICDRDYEEENCEGKVCVWVRVKFIEKLKIYGKEGCAEINKTSEGIKMMVCCDRNGKEEESATKKKERKVRQKLNKCEKKVGE